MISEKNKGNNVEIPVFKKFISKCDELSVNDDSVEKQNPPQPDIFCKTTEGEAIYFELVEFCDKEIAQRQNYLLKKDTDANSCMRTSDKSLAILEKKLVKSYETNGAPLELLCYINGRSASPAQFSEELITRFLKENFKQKNLTPQFRRIWLFSHQRVCKLWPLG